MLAAASLSLASTAANACETEAMMTNDFGFIFKVVAGSDKIKTYKDASGSEESFEMELLRPYFVICEEGDYYRVTDLNADTVDQALAGMTGYVEKRQVHLWNTREALNFSEIAFLEERPEIVAWDDEAVLNDFMRTGNKKLYPPVFQEDLEATRMRERATRPYPVLGSDMRLLRETAEKRVYNVLLPAAISGEAKITGISTEDVERAQVALSTATFVVVFDATGSMEKFALATAKSINGALSSLPKDVRDGSTMGFVFYRDAGDEEKLLSVEPIPLGEAAAALEKAADFMTGGGDVAEPVLDAVYYASNIYDWGQSGRKLMLAVLNGDAKPATIATLDDDGRIPAGMDAFSVARDLYEQGIPAITVQASADAGPNLMPVLQTLSDETGGAFVPWGSGANEAMIAEQVTLLLGERATASVEEGKKVLGQMVMDLNGYASIPLKVLDGEKLERLRAAGVDFNIDPGENGVLVREGYVLENDDLLSPTIQIEKETLLGLVNLYSVLATVGVDEDAMIQSISEAISAIAGEDYDPEDTIEEIVEKKLGIQFRSNLLQFDINYIPAMVPAERLALTKRIQDAATKLSQYLEANQEEFDTQVAVWMPIAVLP
ncbi:VWA domain-containing protein [Vannielia litorea]|uniref:VWA domain-containing protein n=1 Tax=Vannielia litorea TaxID=1217970 RepID=UPI001C957032|nr:VWA domain-containing protein [Vannielia litorea]MBY6153363.1 VWA domain-containing protein [Vannielia litorea]